MLTEQIECRWCTKTHAQSLMCEQARQLLNGLYARGMEFNMPTIEFSEPIRPGVESELGLGPNGQLVTQLIVKAALVPFLGVERPGLIFTGRDVRGQELPQWLYAGDAQDMTRVVKLVADVAKMAVTAARRASRG